MEIRDYNGEGQWSAREILRRYEVYARELGVSPGDLSPAEREERGTRWVFPVMERVIEGIKAGDRACVVLGIDFIEEDMGFPFGRILKANAARALRRAVITEDQKSRVRRRVLGMLRAGYVPREYQEYAKLLVRIGFDGDDLRAVEPHLKPGDARVQRFFDYFARAAQLGAGRAG